MQPMPATSQKSEGLSSWLGRCVAVWLYGRVSRGFQASLRRLVMRLEGGPVYSVSVREILKRYHGITVGMYTIGPCEAGPDNFAPGTVIGRYCSIYYTARVLEEDGPAGVVRWGPAWCPGAPRAAPLNLRKEGTVVGHDVYIGHNAVLLPSVSRVGHGAIVGAGSVVREDVPPYAVVTGNPARVVRYRFRPATVEKLLSEQWWLKSIDELIDLGIQLNRPIEVNEGR
jgi:hypothetical protein